MTSRFDIEGVDASTPLGVAAERILTAKAAPLFALEQAAAGGRDADAVHDMRVASRRLREALRLLGPAYPTKMQATWYATVSEVTKSLGRVRDADVFIATFHRLIRAARDPAELAALAYLIGYRQAERAEQLRRMRKRLAGLDLGRAQKRFAKAVAAPRESAENRRPLGEAAEEALISRLDTACGFLPAALTAEDGASQHEMRIACKQLRYAVETLAPCFGDGFDELHGTLVRFQDVLGDLHDTDVFSDAVRAIRDGGGASEAGVKRRGLDEVLEALAARRARLFPRFRTLCRTFPEPVLREQLLGALIRD